MRHMVMFFGVDDTPVSQSTNRFAGEHYNTTG